MGTTVKDSIIDFPLENSLLSTRQHGFFRSCSCAIHQSDLLNLRTILTGCENAFIVYQLDRTKAFGHGPPSFLGSYIDPVLSGISSYQSQHAQSAVVDEHMPNLSFVTSLK